MLTDARLLVGTQHQRPVCWACAAVGEGGSHETDVGTSAVRSLPADIGSCERNRQRSIYAHIESMLCHDVLKHTYKNQMQRMTYESCLCLNKRDDLHTYRACLNHFRCCGIGRMELHKSKYIDKNILKFLFKYKY